MNNSQKEKFKVLLSQMYEDKNMFYLYISSLIVSDDDLIEDIMRKIQQSKVLIEFLNEKAVEDALLKTVENNLELLNKKISI